MPRVTRVRTWITTLLHRSRVERDMANELQFHIESYAADLVRGGLSPEEARRRARIEFGPIESKKEDCRASLGMRLVDEWSADLRYALRMLRKSPGFAAAAILTLALGIGANTAIFTLVDALVLRPVPAAHPEELYQVRRTGPDTTGRSVDGAFTYALWGNIRQRQAAFSNMAAWGSTTFNLSRGGAVEQADGAWVNGGYFDTLGVHPVLGRLIGPADDRRGCPAIAVLSYAFWQQRYGGAPKAVGSIISLSLHSFEIVGVAPPGVNGLEVGTKFDVAAPLCATAYLDGARSRLDARSWWWLWIVGRIKPGLSREAVNANLAGISSGVMTAAVPQEWSSSLQRPFLQTVLAALPSSSGISESLRDQFSQPLAVLMAVVFLVLFIACANVAALMLARTTAQAREVSVRLALGASRWRVARQLLTHSIVLSLAGATAGVFLARSTTAVLVRSLSTRRMPVFLDLTPDWRVLAFTAAIALVTTVLFGTLPAFRSTRVPVTSTTRGAAAESDHRGPSRTWIVAGQMALSLVLLVTAGLFIRSFARLARLDPGFDPHNVLLVSANLHTAGIDTARHLAIFEDIQSRLRALPGAIAVSRSHIVPLAGGGWNDEVHADTPDAPTGRAAESLMNFVSPGYFATMGTALLDGRDFSPADSPISAHVVIVNQAFARRFFPGLNPIGRIIRVDALDGTRGPDIQVVGVVVNARYRSLRETGAPTAYFPLTQIPHPEFEDTFAIRTAVAPSSFISAVVKVVARVDPTVPLEFNTLERQVDDAMVQERLLAMLSGFFGVVALLLAMIGLYGTVSYHVTLRQTEFGIRTALGAGAGTIVRLVLLDIAAPVVAGVVAGVGFSLLATTAVQKLLYGIGPRDVATIAVCTVLLASVSLAAAYAPARRAARVDPMSALRAD